MHADTLLTTILPPARPTVIAKKVEVWPQRAEQGEMDYVLRDIPVMGRDWPLLERGWWVC